MSMYCKMKLVDFSYDHIWKLTAHFRCNISIQWTRDKCYWCNWLQSENVKRHCRLIPSWLSDCVVQICSQNYAHIPSTYRIFLPFKNKIFFKKKQFFPVCSEHQNTNHIQTKTILLSANSAAGSKHYAMRKNTKAAMATAEPTSDAAAGGAALGR